jgi:hypothetical protein
MSYCQSGDKPTVKYKFSGQNEKIFKSEFAPIVIETGQGTGNIYGETYNPEGFTVVYVGGARETLINIRRHPTNPTWAQFWSCGNFDWDNRQSDGSYPIYYTRPAIASIDHSQKCPPPYAAQNCYIRILHQNIVIHLDRGTCPVTFTVSCGNCPPGTEEHRTNIYPGYCCFDCNSLQAEIRALTNIVKGLNNG